MINVHHGGPRSTRALLAALPETSVDATKALSDADLSALKVAAVEALQS